MNKNKKNRYFRIIKEWPTKYYSLNFLLPIKNKNNSQIARLSNLLIYLIYVCSTIFVILIFLNFKN